MSAPASSRGSVGVGVGVARRAAAGAWHTFAGLWFLVRHPSLWPLALAPSILAVVGLFAGLMLGAYSLRSLESALLPPPGKLSAVPALLLAITLWLGVLAAGALAGLALALMLTAPLLERLSRRAEERARGASPAGSAGLRWELAQSFKGALYLVAAAPGVFLLSLIPLAGPFIAAVWAAHALAFQQTDAPLARRGMGFGAKRAWHRRFRPESLGFGLSGLMLLPIPVLLAPALTVGGTLLVLALEEELPGPDVPARDVPPPEVPAPAGSDA